MSFDMPNSYEDVHEDDMNPYGSLSGNNPWFNVFLMESHVGPKYQPVYLYFIIN